MVERIPEIIQTNTYKDIIPAVSEIYLDGELKKADLVGDNSGSYGIFMHSLILSNDARLNQNNKDNIKVIGNTDEKAITLFTLNKGFDKNLIETIAPEAKGLKVYDDGQVKGHVHLVNNQYRLVAKGDPDSMLQRCSNVVINSRVVKLTREVLNGINKAFFAMISEGLKVYAIAIRDIPIINKVINTKDNMNNMTFVTLIGLGK